MDAKKAAELAKPYLEKGPDGKKTQTLCVMSDGGVYVNNDLKAMKGIAEQAKRDLFVIIGGEVEAPKAEPKKEAPKAPKKAAKKKK